MSGLDSLPFDDYADTRPDVLPFGQARTADATSCEHDSGSMYGNLPLCDRTAAWRVEYHNGSLGGLTATVCGEHRKVTEARAYPGHDRTVEVGQARTADACDGCNAEPGEECRPMCIGYAAHLDTLRGTP